MQWRSVDELCATALNLASNALMLHRMARDPTQRVPRVVLCMQMAANACWFSFAWAHGDPYLMLTSSSSATLQGMSTWMLARAPPATPAPRNAIRLDRSRDGLALRRPLAT
jgi:hypothetical protein